MSFWRAYYHLVWATRNRQPWIQPEVEPHLFAYLIRKSASMGVYVYAINGIQDHIHLVVAIPPHLSIAEVVKNLKGASSHDLKKANILDSSFAWQRGYGVLTLGERQRKDAEAYVNNQKAHHQQGTTNAWLEREAEGDEALENIGNNLPSSPHTMQDEAGAYQVEEPPF